MTTISDWLENAQHGLDSQDSNARKSGLERYIFANNLLGKGYHLDTNVDELLAIYGSFVSIPPREEHEAQC